MDLHDVIIGPWISEKSHLMTTDTKYTFIVNPKANKIQIGEAVEKLFNVKVVSVNTFNIRGRAGTSWTKRRRIRGKGPKMKKAIVTLAGGQSIPELSESS
ncbi:MAG: 50S ribosomal protein L23 [bacterium]